MIGQSVLVMRMHSTTHLPNCGNIGPIVEIRGQSRPKGLIGMELSELGVKLFFDKTGTFIVPCAQIQLLQLQEPTLAAVVGKVASAK